VECRASLCQFFSIPTIDPEGDQEVLSLVRKGKRTS
jgi:hypothetical protein